MNIIAQPHAAALSAETVGELMALINQRLTSMAREASTERTRVLSRYGSFKEYYNKLRLKIVTTPGEEFDRIYDLYSEMFDPGDLYPKTGFYGWFERPKQQTIIERYGNMTYRWLSAEDHADNTHVGLISYLTVPLPKSLGTAYDAALYISFTQIRPRSRMPQLFDFLAQAAHNDIADYLRRIGHIKDNTNPRTIAFTNYLHPLAISPRDYLLDYYAGGINVFERSGWFQLLKFRPMQFDYVRPAATAGKEPMLRCMYAGRALGEQHIDGKLFLYLHERFCAMRQSGFNATHDPYFTKLQQHVNDLRNIPLTDSSTFYLSRLRRRIDEWLDANQKVSLQQGMGSDKTFGEILNLRIGEAA